MKIWLQESTIRSRAKRLGYRVHRAVWARYALIDRRNNAIVLGHQFNADLEEIDIFLRRAAAAVRPGAAQRIPRFGSTARARGNPRNTNHQGGDE
jgi:hypothetical protein